MDWPTIITAVITSGGLTAVLNYFFDKSRASKDALDKKNFQGFQDKLAIYRIVVDLFADFLAEFGYSLEHGTPLTDDRLAEFDKMRMRTFGYLCIYAEQESIDAHEDLIEYIYEVLEGKLKGEWAEVRKRAVRLLNSFRMDYDSKLSTASYNGNR